MNYQFFTNLQFKKILRNSFQCLKIELSDTTAERKTFCVFRIYKSCSVVSQDFR